MKQLESQKILLVGGCGYIGSFLYSKLKQGGAEVVICDTLLRGNALQIKPYCTPYQDLTQDYMRQFSAVLWFAGHSSVPISVDDPHGALANNSTDLYRFARKLSQDCNFIYASTASLYSNNDQKMTEANESSLVRIPDQNPYDCSKFVFDYIAKNWLKKFHGLRMGTLSGWSPNLRPELLFNAMSISASTRGVVKLANPESWRTILFLDDLWCLINVLLTKRIDAQFINVGSLTFPIGELASQISDIWGAKIVRGNLK